MAKKLKPMHPGEVLREEFLVPLKMSAGALAKACGLPRTRIERIASEQTGMTADTALRLAKALPARETICFDFPEPYEREATRSMETGIQRDACCVVGQLLLPPASERPSGLAKLPRSSTTYRLLSNQRTPAVACYVQSDPASLPRLRRPRTSQISAARLCQYGPSCERA